MEIRKISETATVVTLGWEPVAGAAGYRFTVDGKISHTWDGTRETVRVSKDADLVLIEVLGVTDSGVWPAEPEPEPGSPPLWNGDWETGNRSQYGGLEYGGTFDGTPPVSERVIVSKGIDGFTALQGDWFAKLITAPGDQYGSSTGWRTVFRTHEPLRKRGVGYDTSWTMAVLLPSGYPGDANVWQSGFEYHGTEGSPGTHHMMFYRDTLRIDMYSGAPSGSGKVEEIDTQVLQGYAKGKWHVFAFRYKVGRKPDGHYELWHGQAGKDTRLSRLIYAPGIGTVFNDGFVYAMIGQYRAQTGSSVMSTYYDACREYASLEDAKAFAESLL